MDVCLLNRRPFFLFILTFCFCAISCGDRFNIDTERGRNARIDEANYQLSTGNCQGAIDIIDPLYSSGHVTDEIRILKASAYACFADFSLLNLIANLSSNSNYFSALAKSMPNTVGDGRLEYLYSAVDVLTNDSSTLNASSRGKSINTYMVFLQLAVVGEILAGYGNPDASGNQGTDLSYANPRVDGNMSNTNACALSAAMSTIADSYNYSSVSDSNSTAAVTAINSACTSAGYTCSNITRDRSSCTGLAADAPSLVAVAIVASVNSAW